MKKKKTCSTPTLIRVCVALAVLVGVVLNVSPAFAEALNVSGTDFIFADGQNDGSVDILTVTGKPGDTVYINMKKGDQVIASHLAFTLDENTAKDENGDMVGAVSVQFNDKNLSYNDTYGIEVYSDRAETKEGLLYTGNVSTVFAKVGKDAPQALAIRTIGEKDGNRQFKAPESMKDSDGIVYKLSNQETQDVDGKQCYIYSEAEQVADSTEAHVYYYDVNNAGGDPIKTDKITLAKNASQDVQIDSIIAGDDGSIYRTLTLADKVSVAYPGVTDHTVMCKKLTGESWGQNVGSFYKATIKYTDDAGKDLGVVDSVIVNKTYIYTAPDRLYVDDNGTVKQYQIKDKSKATLKLEPGAAEGSKDFAIEYVPIKDDEPRTWTVVLQNGAADPKNQSERELGRITLKGLPGQTVTFDPRDAKNEELTKRVDLNKFVPAAASDHVVSHTFSVADMDVEQTVYYVPSDYVEPEAYTVTVDYVNIANNETITSQTYTASPSMRSDLEITSPESFSQDGIEWVRLMGQEKAIRHSYYSTARKYTVYYRDINDDLHAQTVIRTVRVVYIDEEGNTVTRPTTVVDNGTTTTTTTTDEGTTTTDAAGGATGAAGAADAAQAATTDTGLQTDSDLRAIDGQDGNVLVGQDGTDTATTRIEDDATPLANSPAGEAASKINPVAIGVGGGIAAIAAAGLILFFVFKRRKKGTEESSDDDLTA